MPSNFGLFRHTALPSFRAGNQIIISNKISRDFCIASSWFSEELTFIDNNLITK